MFIVDAVAGENTNEGLGGPGFALAPTLPGALDKSLYPSSVSMAVKRQVLDRMIFQGYSSSTCRL